MIPSCEPFSDGRKIMMGRQAVDQSQLFYLFNLEERRIERRSHSLRVPRSHFATLNSRRRDVAARIYREDAPSDGVLERLRQQPMEGLAVEECRLEPWAPQRRFCSRGKVLSHGDVLPDAVSPAADRPSSRVFRASRLPQGGPQVLGSDLNRSESRRGAQPSRAWSKRIARLSYSRRLCAAGFRSSLWRLGISFGHSGDVGSMSGLPESGRQSALSRCRTSAISGCEQSQQDPRLFDHLVGTQKHRRRDGEIERLRGPEIHYQLELRWLLDR
jgi:hypothetical protein